MSQQLTVTGKVVLVENKQTFASGFEKQVCIVEEEADRYPTTFPFEFAKEKMELLHNVQRGDRVTVSYNIRTNQSGDRWFVNLQAWKVEVTDRANIGGQQEMQHRPSQPSAAGGDIEEDVPFAPFHEGIV